MRNALIVLVIVALALVTVGIVNHAVAFDVDFLAVTWSGVSLFWVTVALAALMVLAGVLAALLAQSAAVSVQRKLEVELATTYERLRAAEAALPPAAAAAGAGSAGSATAVAAGGGPAEDRLVTESATLPAMPAPPAAAASATAVTAAAVAPSGGSAGASAAAVVGDVSGERPAEPGMEPEPAAGVVDEGAAADGLGEPAALAGPRPSTSAPEPAAEAPADEAPAVASGAARTEGPGGEADEPAPETAPAPPAGQAGGVALDDPAKTAVTEIVTPTPDPVTDVAGVPPAVMPSDSAPPSGRPAS